MSDTIRLAGVRNDSLHSYLKAIGILRLVSTQHASTVTAAWRDGALELANIARPDLEAFFFHRYEPTPILNPWNSGAGFDAKSRTQEAGKTLARIEAESSRWPAYADALATARRIAESFADDESDTRKRDMLLRLRADASDTALEWIDAAVLVGGAKLGFPAVLGTGGNDGRLDFSINFAQRALDVVGSRPVAQRDHLLTDALDATSTAPLVRGIFGQYRLGSGGLLNPWDFVFAIEGAIAFAGSIARRFPGGSDRLTAPFQFDAIAAGYAAASEDEETRGELWLPAWRGRATYRAVRNMLRAGRVDLVDDRPSEGSPTRVASRASDSIAAVAAAQTYGVASGIDSFARVVIAQRNGLAFGATYAGRIPVSDRPEIAALSRETRAWIQQASRAELGASGREALRSYRDGMIAYASRPSAAAFQDVLASLASLDDAMALAQGEHRPLPFLSADIHAAIDTMLRSQASPHGVLEHRMARALTSVGLREPRHRLRYRISCVAFDSTRRSESYDSAHRHVWAPDVRDTLAAYFERTVRDAAQSPRDAHDGFAARLGGSFGIGIDDVAQILAGRCDWGRVRTLVRAYSIVTPYVRTARPDPARPTNGQPERSGGAGARVIPMHFVAVKTLVDGWYPGDLTGAAAIASSTYLDSETAAQLVSGLTKRAFDGAYARLRAAGAAVRDFRTASIDDRRTFVATLAIPVTHGTDAALRKRLALSPDDSTAPEDEIRNDTTTLSFSEEL